MLPPTEHSEAHGSGVRAGARYLIRGLRLAKDPDILPYFLVPLFINMLIFGSLMYWSLGLFNEWIGQLLAWVPNWLSWLEWVLWPLLLLMMVLVVFYTFTLAANMVASPFNGLLAEKVAAKLRRTNATQGESLLLLLQSIPGSLLREIRKLLYFIPIGIVVWLISAFTPLAVVAPLLWFLFTAWTLALEYCDYQADNDQVSFSAMRSATREQKSTALGFGAAVAVGTMIPILNLLVMPAAVCGATLLWIERFYRPSGG